MEKRKQKRSIAIVLLTMLFMCITCLAVLFATPSVWEKVKGEGAEEEAADTVKSIEYVPAADPVATYYLGDYKAPDETNHIYYRPFTQGWAEAVKAATKAYEEATSANKPKTYVKVVLVYDWTASASTTSTTSFGTDAAAYHSGRIYVPEGANIVLELNGRKIDRNLIHTEEGTGDAIVDKSTPVANGHVILVQGNLTILDSSDAKTGKITGSYAVASASDYSAGSIYVDGGTVNLYGGAITDNRASAANAMGIGVSIKNSGAFNMYGGAISNNVPADKTKASYGGGVCVYASGAFSMYGGVIENNFAKTGGGVCSYSANGFPAKDRNGEPIKDKDGDVINAVVTIDGGVIRNNQAMTLTRSVKAENFGGGGIGVFTKGNVIINSGYISHNTTDRFGGGVSVLFAAAATNLYINGGSIHDNVAGRLDYDVYGGGIAMRRLNTTAGTAAGVSGNIYMTGGSVVNNYTVSYNLFYKNSEDKVVIVPSEGKEAYFNLQSMGAGIYNDGGAITMTDGKVGDNIGYSIQYTHEGENGAVPDASAKSGYLALAQQDLEKAYTGDFSSKSLTDKGYSFGAGVYINKTTATSYSDRKGILIMYGGSIYGNRANSGGGVCLRGDFEMYGGEVTGNYGLYGGIYIQANSTVKLAGSPKIYGNLSILDGETPANMEVSVSPYKQKSDGTYDLRAPQIVGAFNDDANVNMFTTSQIIADGLPITQGYGKNNRMYVTFDGTNEAKYASYDEAGNGIGEPINKGVWVYANPYRYFGSDKTFLVDNTTIDGKESLNQHLIVISGEKAIEAGYDGELGVATYPITFKVTYSDNSVQEFKYGEKYDDMPMWNYVSSVYGSVVYPTRITAYKEMESGREQLGELNLEEQKGEDGRLAAKEYGLTVTSGITTTTTSGNQETRVVNANAQITFYVVVIGNPISDADQETEDLKIEISSDEGFHYQKGEEHKPTVTSITYTLNGETITLLQGVDFEVTYENNINAGKDTAAVVINFIGNYTGTARVYFSIKSSESTDVTTSVAWQVWSEEEEEWVAYDEHSNIFTYTGSDLSKNIRATLTTSTGDDKQAVYVEGYTHADAEGEEYSQNKSMYLVFYQGTYQDGQSSCEFINAGTYEIYVWGSEYVNYPINEEGRTLHDVTLSPMEITLSDADFNSETNYKDAKGNRLWSLLIGETDTLTSTLLDSAVYIDNNNGVDNGSGIKTAQGNKTDYYARFRDTSLALDLNRSYVLSNNMTIGELLSHAKSVSDISWSTAASYEINTVKIVTTQFVITFDNNYHVGENNSITFTKEWCIVTMNNALRNADTGETITETNLKSWTYGLWDEVQAEIFRPEHGTTVIYTYYKLNKNGSVEKVATQFAIVYSDATSSATISFYGVKTDSKGKLVADTSKLLGGQYYLYTINFGLEAGSYKVEITIPEVEPHTSDHTHWYDEDAVANDLGVIYYELTYKFDLTVAVYNLTSESFAEGGDIRVDFPSVADNWVYYNGQENNIVGNIVITLSAGKAREKVLVEGVDYELSSTSINAGNADLIITGKNGLVGTYTIKNAYRIAQAINGWYDLPSLASWTYGAFDIMINLVKGEHNFGRGGLSFAISTSESKDDIILENITLLEHDGVYVVSTEVANFLNGLDVGYYYLFAYAEETSNYSGLENSVQFRVFTANNSWTNRRVDAWIEGQYVDFGTHVFVESAFGSPHIVITDAKGKVVYYDNADPDNIIDILASAKPGQYKIIASVADGTNFYGLEDYIIEFEVFKKPGLPWWATVIAVVGSLGVAALIIFILWKQGVFRIITDKILIAIRTRVSVESTIASVRAAKMMEEGRRSVADAKRRERLEKLRQKAKEQREMSPEDRAAMLEAKAKADAERAEKFRTRSESALAKAAKMRKDEPHPAQEAPEIENQETSETQETPVSETHDTETEE